MKYLLERCFKLRMSKNEISAGDDELIFEIRFNPMKPFKSTFDLIVSRDIGGVWKFPISLEAIAPEADDLIVI